MTLLCRPLTASQIMPSERELARRLRAPRSEDAPGVGEMVSRLSGIASAAAVICHGPADAPLLSLLGEAGEEYKHFSHIGVFAVTLGHAVDREIAACARRGAAEAFVCDAVASAMAEAAADAADNQLRLLTPHVRWQRRRSPGYGKLSLSLQPTLLRLCCAGQYLGIALTETNLMIPAKSITAILGGNDEARTSD